MRYHVGPDGLYMHCDDLIDEISLTREKIGDANPQFTSALSAMEGTLQQIKCVMFEDHATHQASALGSLRSFLSFGTRG